MSNVTLIITQGLLDNSGKLGEASRKNVRAILDALARVSVKLRATFRHLERLNGRELVAGVGDEAEALSYINEKWQSYLASSRDR